MSLARLSWSLLVLFMASVVVADDKVIKVDGSSTVFPVTEAVAEEFQAETGGKVKVTVGISGTGGGFKKFVRGEIDVADASRPILEKEIADARANGIEYIELPIAFDALTVLVSTGNTWVDHLTVDELKKVWAPEAQGKIKNWSQVRDGFPDAPLTLYGAGSDSGTFDYFTEAIVGKAKSSRGDYTGTEDDNIIISALAGDKNALGYLGYAYYVSNKDKVKAVPIVKGSASPVAPSLESVVDGSYQPLSRPIFIYVNKKSLERPEVKQFVEFYLQHAEELVKEVSYIPLPSESYKSGQERLAAGKTGSVFGGKAEVGVHISDLFSRELKN